MSGVTVIQPTQDLVSFVAAHLQSLDGDYSRNLVVFPGRRPAHFLRKVLAEREGQPFIPPQILSIEEFITSIVGGHAAPHVRTIDTLDAVGILFDLHSRQQGRLGGDHFTDLDRFFPLGEKLFNELEEMKMAMLSPETVAEQTSMIDYANLFTIAELYESFYRALERENLSTRAHAYARAAATFNSADLEAYGTVILGGLYALTHSEQVLIRAIHACEQSYLVFVQGPGLSDHLRVLGLEDDGTSEDAPMTDGPRYEFVRAPDLHGQLAALGAVVSRTREAGAPEDERSVLMLPRPDALFPVVNHFLPLFDDDGYNISMGYPLARTPLSGLFHSLFEAMERKDHETWFVPDYLRVMLHPYVKSVRYGERTDVTRILVHTVEEWLAASPGRSMRRLQDMEESDELFTRAVLRLGEDEIDADMLKAHLRSLHDVLFRPWNDSATLGEFAEHCADIVRFVHDRTTASRHPFFRSFSGAMLESVQVISDSLLATTRMSSVRSSFALLQHIIRTKNVPFPGSPLHGFQVLGLLETRGLTFDNVYVVEANDDVLPGSSGPDHLLPEMVRTRLGMETRQDREQIIAYYLSVLFASAKRVWISWDDSAGKEKSRFVERLLWDQEQRRGELIDTASLPLVQYGLSLEAESPAPVTKTEAEATAISRRSLSAGALDTYLRCQLRFYYTYVLGLSSPEDLSGEIDQADIGDLVHGVLQQYFGSFAERVIRTDDLDADTIRQMAEIRFDETFGTASSAASLLMRERISDQLGRFITSYQKPMTERTSVTITSLEETLEGMIGSTRFRMRTDRVEVRNEGSGSKRYHILDYKTGGNAVRNAIRFDKLDPEDRSTWHDAIGSFQLFLYTLLYARAKKLDVSEVDASFLFLGRQTVDESIEVGLFDKEVADRQELLSTLEGIVRKLIMEMSDPEVPFHPTEHLENDCPDCPFKTICGTTWTDRRGGW